MDVNVLLPASGPGFVTNNRGNDQFQFGQQSSIDAAEAVGAAWNELHPDKPFSIGQISKSGGGTMPPHKSHKLGVDIDVRPMRKDGANAPVEITQSQYDRELTTELIDLWWRKAPVQNVFFNDQTVISAALSQFVNGHGNHFHVRLRAKDAEIRIGDRGSDVAEVQKILGVGSDGRFGSVTLHAVEDFQVAHNLHPDGVVGSNTWKKLREFAASQLIAAAATNNP
jgi:hypothetical protein